MAAKPLPSIKRAKHPPGNSSATGPKTEAGKSRASQNALTHGATSPKLLNDQERASYTAFLGALQKTYPGTNPLVLLQLERIARLKIQLDRIQDVIDASFRVERLMKPDFERASDALNLTKLEQSQMARWLAERVQGQPSDSLIDQDLLAVSLELSEIDDYGLLTTYEDFETYLPNFCKYIVAQATERNQELENYLSSRRIEPSEMPPISKNARLPQRVKAEVEIRFVGENFHVDVKPELRKASIPTLQSAAHWFRLQLWELMRRVYRTREMIPLVEAAPEAAMPDPDKLDRLMRYQTTINRQLSTAMGELLELIKLG